MIEYQPRPISAIQPWSWRNGSNGEKECKNNTPRALNVSISSIGGWLPQQCVYTCAFLNMGSYAVPFHGHDASSLVLTEIATFRALADQGLSSDSSKVIAKLPERISNSVFCHTWGDIGMTKKHVYLQCQYDPRFHMNSRWRLAFDAYKAIGIPPSHGKCNSSM